MLRIVFFLFVWMNVTLIFGQTNAVESNGIQFFQGSWKELLAEAKKSNKPFFVDVYTTWCGPCKLMSKNTFTDENVGKYTGSNYLAYKIDAEKGEGIKVAENNKVRAYPTILFFDASGKRIGKEEGYMDAERFLYTLEKYIAKQGKK